MSASDLIGRDRVSDPGLDGAEGASFNARDLNESCDRVAGHSQMMFQRRLRRVLDDLGTRVICRREECRGHRRCDADLRLATALGGRPPAVGQALSGMLVACIGPVTARTAQELGIRVDVVAREHTIQGLVDAIVLTPTASGEELGLELRSNLAAMLGAAQNAKRSRETGDLSLQVQMVGGAGGRRCRQPCTWSRPDGGRR